MALKWDRISRLCLPSDTGRTRLWSDRKMPSLLPGIEAGQLLRAKHGKSLAPTLQALLENAPVEIGAEERRRRGGTICPQRTDGARNGTSLLIVKRPRVRCIETAFQAVRDSNEPQFLSHTEHAPADLIAEKSPSPPHQG